MQIRMVSIIVLSALLTSAPQLVILPPQGLNFFFKYYGEVSA